MDFSFGSKSPEDKLINALQNPNASQSQIDSALKNISSLDNPEKAKRIFTAMKSRRDREASFPPPKSSWFVWSRPGRLENADLTTVLTIAQRCIQINKPTGDATSPVSQNTSQVEDDDPENESFLVLEDQTKSVHTDNSSLWQTYEEPPNERIEEIARIITESSSNKPIQKRSWSWFCFPQKPTTLNQEEKPVLTTKISKDDLQRLNTEDQELFAVVGYNRLRKLFDRIPKQEISLHLDSQEPQMAEQIQSNKDFPETENVNSNAFLKTIETLTVPKLDIPGNQEIDGLIQIIKINDKNSKEFARALKKIEALPYILPEKKAEIVLALSLKINEKIKTSEDTSGFVKQQDRFYRWKTKLRNSISKSNLDEMQKDLIKKLYDSETSNLLEQNPLDLSVLEQSPPNKDLLDNNFNIFIELICSFQLKEDKSTTIKRSSSYDKDYPWALVVDIEVADNKTEKICLGYFKNPVQQQLETLVSGLCKKIPGKVVSAKVSHLDKAPKQEYIVMNLNTVGEDPIKELETAMSNKFPKDFTDFKAVQNLTAYSIPQQDGSFKAINVAKQMEGLFTQGDRIVKISIDNSIAECPGTFANDFITGRAPIEFCGHNFQELRSEETGQQLADAFTLVASEYKAMCKATIDKNIDPNALFVIIHQGALKPLADYAGYFIVKLGDEEKERIQYKAIPPSVEAFFQDGNFVIEYQSKLQHQTKNDQRPWIPFAEVSCKRRVTIPISELQKVIVTKEESRDGEKYVLENIPENIQATDSWGDYTVLLENDG